MAAAPLPFKAVRTGFVPTGEHPNWLMLEVLEEGDISLADLTQKARAEMINTIPTVGHAMLCYMDWIFAALLKVTLAEGAFVPVQKRHTSLARIDEAEC